jgi:uncharacterized glyoxalase superfamily protein PhnB
MQFEGLIPVLICQQIENTLMFYQKAFRYIIIQQSQDQQGRLHWAHLKSDNTTLMLQRCIDDASSTQSSTGNIMLHYYTSDILAQQRYMRANGVVVGEIETTSYDMQQFHVTDPEGNLLSIGQRAED